LLVVDCSFDVIEVENFFLKLLIDSLRVLSDASMTGGLIVSVSLVGDGDFNLFLVFK
jgi:hypothetical protein